MRIGRPYSERAYPHIYLCFLWGSDTYPVCSVPVRAYSGTAVSPVILKELTNRPGVACGPSMAAHLFLEHDGHAAELALEGGIADGLRFAGVGLQVE
jgi:hypothetical protein